MNVEAELISGVNVGIEFFNDEIFGRGFLVDLVIFRFLFTWSNS